MKYTFSKQTKRGISRIFWKSAETAPIILPVALAAFGTIASLFLLIGQFKDIYVWPAGLLAALLASSVVWKSYPKSLGGGYARRACNVLVILGVLVWGIFNAFYTAQHIIIDRDPAIYTNAGIWLAEHDSLKIPAPDIFGDVSGIHRNSPAFKADYNDPSGPLYAQGQHLLPALIGLSARILGVPHALHINVMFGMTAILATYALARALVRRTWWALVAAGIVASSMPLIYFTRDAFTEPLAATFTLGALALIWVALKAKNLSLWFLAGLVAGAGTLTRIDGLLTVAELLMFISIMLIVSVGRERRERLLQAVAFTVGMGATATIGWLDVSQLSPAYATDLHTQFHRVNLTVLLVLILGVIGVVVGWRTNLLHKLERLTRSWRPQAVAVLIVASVVLLMSRPLWHMNFSTITLKRNYTELTTQWISWYIGASVAILGVLGILLAANKAVRHTKLLLTACLLVVIGTSAVYLIQPSISPDQIWASRRLLPVILPGLVCFAAIALDWLSDQYMTDEDKYKKIIAVFIGIALILPALITSKSLLDTRIYTQLEAINTMCKTLPDDSAVLWVGTARLTMVQPTRSVCGLPAYGYGQQAQNFVTLSTDKVSSQSVLANIHAAASSRDRTTVIGVLESEKELLPSNIRNNLKPAVSYQFQKLENTLTGPPKKFITEHNIILIGLVQPNGSVTPL